MNPSVFVGLLFMLGIWRLFLIVRKQQKEQVRQLEERAWNALMIRSDQDLLEILSDKKMKCIWHIAKQILHDRSGFYTVEEDVIVDGIAIKKGERIWMHH